MPVYEYHCPTCRSTFEMLRPMSRSTDDATCPSGHKKATRVLSLVANRPREAGAPSSGGGCGGCGGGCSCGG